jgi:hypothetical protein
MVLRFACLGIAAAVTLAFVGCDNGTGGTGGSPNYSGCECCDTGCFSGPSTTSARNRGTPIVCGSNYCRVAMGGYAFSFADGDPPLATPTGMSHAMLVPGQLCITGHVMAFPPNGTPTDFANDWGAGIGVNLNQRMGFGTPRMAFTPTGKGVTVNTNGVPMCAGALLVVDNDGTDYCTLFYDDGTEIPWTRFSTPCLSTIGTHLLGPPNATALKIQFVPTKEGACDFENFCFTRIRF